MLFTASVTQVFDVAGTALFVASIVGISKDLLNPLAAPGTKGQNNVVRAYVFVVSLITVCALSWLSYSLDNRTELLQAISTSLQVGISAIATYHILTSDTPSPTTLGPAGTIATWTIPPPIPGSAPNIVPPMPPLPDPPA